MIHNSIPRAYREGKTNFYGYDFIVNRHTLIPRPETEQLVEKAVEYSTRYLPANLRILDVGTGSGVIAIILKKLLPASAVEATEISPEALSIARQNAISNEVAVTFHEGSLFDSISGKFDLIVANLPYVPAARWQHLESQVRDFEPKSAIVAGVDGLKWIKQFCSGVNKHLKERSIVALEIDNIQGRRVQEILRQTLPQHLVLGEKDLAGHDRFCFGLPISPVPPTSLR